MLDLSAELLRMGLLRRLYTAYPWWKLEELPQSSSRSFPAIFLARESLRRLRLARLASFLDKPVALTFDFWVSRVVESCDVFHCLSGFGMRTYATVREHFNARIVCDRGSAHILEQDRLLREEYDRWHISFDGIPDWAVERELTEYAGADAIVVPSTFARDSFLAHGVPAEKVNVVPLGVNVELFRPLPKNHAKFRVLFVGQISIRKGIGDLLAAMRAHVARGEIEVWLAGTVDRAAVPILRRFDGVFRLLGHIPRRRLAEIYSEASVLVLPSLEEGLALVLAQGMACGLPVIATNHTGASDLFADGVEGFIIPIRRPDILAERVQRLLRDPGLRGAMGMAALARARKLRGWNAYGESILEVYERIFTGGPRLRFS